MIRFLFPLCIFGGLVLLIAWRFFSSPALTGIGHYGLVLSYLFTIALAGAMRWKGWL